MVFGDVVGDFVQNRTDVYLDIQHT